MPTTQKKKPHKDESPDVTSQAHMKAALLLRLDEAAPPNPRMCSWDVPASSRPHFLMCHMWGWTRRSPSPFTACEFCSLRPQVIHSLQILLEPHSHPHPTRISLWRPRCLWDQVEEVEA